MQIAFRDATAMWVSLLASHFFTSAWPRSTCSELAKVAPLPRERVQLRPHSYVQFLNRGLKKGVDVAQVAAPEPPLAHADESDRVGDACSHPEVQVHGNGEQHGDG